MFGSILREAFNHFMLYLKGKEKLIEKDNRHSEKETQILYKSSKRSQPKKTTDIQRTEQKKIQEYFIEYYKTNKGIQNCKTQQKQKNSNQKKSIEISDSSDFNIFENDNTENMQKIYWRLDKKICHATTVDDEDTGKPDPNMQRSNVCVVCDRLIIGMEEVKKRSKKHLILNKQCLSVQQYKDHYSLTLKPDLIGQYQVSGR
jgi:hypothetical protein